MVMDRVALRSQHIITAGKEQRVLEVFRIITKRDRFIWDLYAKYTGQLQFFYVLKEITIQGASIKGITISVEQIV